MQVLTAYLREHAAESAKGNGGARDAANNEDGVARPDFLAISDVIRRRRSEWDGEEPLDCSGADLRGARFQRASLWRAKFINAQLQGADFRGAHLREAYFDGAQLHRAYFGRDLGQGIHWLELRLHDSRLSEHAAPGSLLLWSPVE
jgi:uncharacterized protein YjbI with pentapeptide repeats